MAITQPIGNVRVMPQAPDTGDPLAGMKAFAVGTQLGQELAGLSLASDKLKFEKAKLRAQEAGLAFEQNRAQFALAEAQRAAQMQAETDRLAKEKSELEVKMLRREAALGEIDIGKLGSALLGATVSTPEATPVPEPVLAEAEVAPAAAPVFSVAQPAPAAPAPASPKYAPKFVSAEQDPTVRFSLPAGAPSPDAAAAAAVEAGRQRDIKTFLDQLQITQLTSLKEARAMLVKIPEFKAQLASRKPGQGDVRTVDAQGTPLIYPAAVDDKGSVVSVVGEPRIDVETLHKSNAAAKAADETYAKAYADVLDNPPKAAENIETLRWAIGELEKANFATGAVVGAIPEFIAKRVPGLSTGVNIQTAIEQVVSQSLREILGGQFAMREGEQLLKRAFDRAMPESENAKRAQRLLSTLEASAEASAAAREYFRANGTLFGFAGESPGAIRARIETSVPAAAAPAANPRAAEAKAAADLLSGYRKGMGLD